MYDVDGQEPDFVHAPYNLAAMMIYAGWHEIWPNLSILNVRYLRSYVLVHEGDIFFRGKIEKKSSIEKKLLKNRKNMILEHFKE